MSITIALIYVIYLLIYSYYCRCHCKFYNCVALYLLYLSVCCEMCGFVVLSTDALFVLNKIHNIHYKSLSKFVHSMLFTSIDEMTHKLNFSYKKYYYKLIQTIDFVFIPNITNRTCLGQNMSWKDLISQIRRKISFLT